MRRGTQLLPAVEFGGVGRNPAYETAIQDARDDETAIAEAEAQLENKRVTRDEKVAALPSGCGWRWGRGAITGLADHRAWR